MREPYRRDYARPEIGYRFFGFSSASYASRWMTTAATA